MPDSSVKSVLWRWIARMRLHFPLKGSPSTSTVLAFALTYGTLSAEQLITFYGGEHEVLCERLQLCVRAELLYVEDRHSDPLQVRYGLTMPGRSKVTGVQRRISRRARVCAFLCSATGLNKLAPDVVAGDVSLEMMRSMVVVLVLYFVCLLGLFHRVLGMSGLVADVCEAVCFVLPILARAALLARSRRRGEADQDQSQVGHRTGIGSSVFLEKGKAAISSLCDLRSRLTRSISEAVRQEWPLIRADARLVGHVLVLLLLCVAFMSGLIALVAVIRAVLDTTGISLPQVILGDAGAAAVGVLCLVDVVLARAALNRIGKSAEHIRELLAERVDGDSAPATSAAEECVALFREEMRVLLGPISEVIEQAREQYGQVKLETIIGMLRERAKRLERKGHSEGSVIKDLACYLGSLYYTPAGDKFDEVVAGGACPLALIQDLLGW